MKAHLLTTIIFLFIIGICIGILAGLSVSPVIKPILTTILTIVASSIAVWNGISSQDRKNNSRLPDKINLLPITILVIGLTGGCFLGIYMRTHDVLSPKEAIISSSDKHPLDLHKATVLFSVEQSTCDIVNAYSGQTLITQLRNINDSNINKVIDSIGENNVEAIKIELQRICL